MVPLHSSVAMFLISVIITVYKSTQKILQYIQNVSRLYVITAGGDFLGLCDEKSSYKDVSDFGRLQSYDHLKLRIEGNDYWQ
jgi:hypothetical protein